MCEHWSACGRSSPSPSFLSSWKQRAHSGIAATRPTGLPTREQLSAPQLKQYILHYLRTHLQDTLILWSRCGSNVERRRIAFKAQGSVSPYCCISFAMCGRLRSGLCRAPLRALYYKTAGLPVRAYRAALYRRDGLQKRNASKTAKILPERAKEREQK